MEFDEHAVYQEQARYTTVVLSPRFQPVLGHVGAHVFSLPTRPVTRIESGLHSAHQDQGCIWCNITSSLLCDGFLLFHVVTNLPTY